MGLLGVCRPQLAKQGKTTFFWTLSRGGRLTTTFTRADREQGDPVLLL